jgi:16S rRNA (guanine966-N2)-methyltransferase
VRVIAGSFGGRLLRAPRGAVTRPTSDRVREATFALLGGVAGARVLDLFAGAGGLGIEALSRGAAHAVFIERNERAVRALRANLDSLGIGAEDAQVRRAEVTTALRAARKSAETYDLVFIDPPYSRASDLGRDLERLLSSLLEPCARIVVESDRRAPMGLDVPLERERTYGDTLIKIHRHQ